MGRALVLFLVGATARAEAPLREDPTQVIAQLRKQGDLAGAVAAARACAERFDGCDPLFFRLSVERLIAERRFAEALPEAEACARKYQSCWLTEFELLRRFAEDDALAKAEPALAARAKARETQLARETLVDRTEAEEQRRKERREAEFQKARALGRKFAEALKLTDKAEARKRLAEVVAATHVEDDLHLRAQLAIAQRAE